MNISKTPTLKGGQMITIAYFIGIILILFIVYKLLGKIGIVKTSAKRQAEKTAGKSIDQLRTDDIFNPDYFKGKTFKQLGNNTAKKYATDIRNSLAGFGTNEETIFSTFGKLDNKIQVSEVVNQYKLLHGFPLYIMSDNLQSDLLDELTKTEVSTLMNIINNLPNK
jgi:hypothetical protein